MCLCSQWEADEVFRVVKRKRVRSTTLAVGWSYKCVKVLSMLPHFSDKRSKRRNRQKICRCCWILNLHLDFLSPVHHPSFFSSSSNTFTHHLCPKHLFIHLYILSSLLPVRPPLPLFILLSLIPSPFHPRFLLVPFHLSFSLTSLSFLCRLPLFFSPFPGLFSFSSLLVFPLPEPLVSC